jgi:serine/threonine-protein kinase
MLWEAAAGDKMWKGLGEATIMNRIINDELPSLSQQNPSVSPELVAIVNKALANDAADRYQTALALQDDIEHYLAQRGSTVRLRELGKVVQELFADTREETRRTIEAQLTKVGSLSPDEYAATEPIELTHIGQSAASSASKQKPAIATAPPRRAWVLGLVALATVAVLGTLLWLGRSAPTASDSGRAASAPAAAPAILVRITAFPASSKIYLDGELLPSNPASRSVASDTRTHVLEARAEGYQNEQREVRFDQNQDIVLALNAARGVGPSAAPSSSTPKSRPARSTKPAPSPAASARSVSPNGNVDCNPPYTLDAHGVKQFKLQCL